MNKSQKNLLTGNEIIFMIFGSMVGVGVLSIPNDVVKMAFQDGWISTAIGSIYPIYMILIAMYFINKFPNDNIIVLNKKYLGKFLGSVMNFIFFTYTIFLTSAVASGYVNVLRIFDVKFLQSNKILMILFFIVAYTCGRGLKVIGRTSVVVFYITVIIFLLPIQALKIGNITNIRPIGGTSIMTILIASKTTIFAYMGIEIIFLIYPCVQDKKSFIKNCFIGTFITTVVYTWVTFVCTYYLGPDIVIKAHFPFLTIIQVVNISIISNFRLIFILLWSLTVVKALSNDYIMGLITLQDFIKKIKMKKLSYLTISIVFILSLKLSNILERGNIVPKISEYYLIFDLVYVTLLAIVIFIKEDLKQILKR